MRTNDPYAEGVTAGLAGLENWRNPYAGPTGGIQSFQGWFAGWCQGMQSRALQAVPKLNKETPP